MLEMSVEEDFILPNNEPWHVYAKWLDDSEMFNEWCNPIDFQIDE